MALCNCREGAEHMMVTIQDFDKRKLISLLAQFRSVVYRECDIRLAEVLEEDLLARDTPRLRASTITRLAKWCKTDGIYADGMVVAKKISLLVFGKILDRNALGV
jgi:hypothetical protein